MTLGADDQAFGTSLSGVDLYPDIARHIAAATDFGGGHPLPFYLAMGYVITGVLPDANGPGKPDIFMSKSIAAR